MSVELMLTQGRVSVTGYPTTTLQISTNLSQVKRECMGVSELEFWHYKLPPPALYHLMHIPGETSSDGSTNDFLHSKQAAQ
jgi:hypothetical protein